MSRNIITKGLITTLGAEETSKEDPYVSKIIKLIPADIISVYLAVFNIVKSNSQNADGNSTLQWIVFGLILVITPFYLKKVAQINTSKQIMFCTISFIVWVFSLGGPLDGVDIGGYTAQFLGAVFLPIYTLLIPLLYQQTDSE
jgi:hypothetical protein